MIYTEDAFHKKFNDLMKKAKEAKKEPEKTYTREAFERMMEDGRDMWIEMDKERDHLGSR